MRPFRIELSESTIRLLLESADTKGLLRDMIGAKIKRKQRSLASMERILNNIK